ncbi:unnamed protein product [marine sediment metagenome]|uniref:Uncharacterized protein n=1 Tax=marine sediment metagenome TaxID=412755 RepID=X1G4X8_9ZZZZ
MSKEEFEKLKRRYKKEIEENKNGEVEFRKEWLKKVGGEVVE